MIGAISGVGTISGAGSASAEILSRAQQEILAALAVEQAAEQKLAAAAVRGNQGAQGQEAGSLIDIMA